MHGDIREIEASEAVDSDSSYADERAPDEESALRKRPLSVLAAEAATACAAPAKRPKDAGDAGDPAVLVAKLKCPITSRLFVDPVTLSVDQHVYEHAAIRRWIEDKGTSPLTREQVDKDDPSALTRVRLVRDLVSEAVERRLADPAEIEEYRHDLATRAGRRAFYEAQLAAAQKQLADFPLFDGDALFRWQDRSMRVALLLVKQEAKEHLETYYPRHK